MTTATKELIQDWKEVWQDFYDEHYEWEDVEKLSEQAKNRLKMLDYTNENIDLILSKLEPMSKIFPHLTEAWHSLNLLLDGDQENCYFESLSFEMQINEYIQIMMEPRHSVVETMQFECLILFNDDCISFILEEGESEDLHIIINELKHQS